MLALPGFSSRQDVIAYREMQQILATTAARAVVTTVGVDALRHPCQELLLGVPPRNQQLLQPVIVDRAEMKASVVLLDECRQSRTWLPPLHDVVGGRLQPLPPYRVQCPYYGR